jgi:hypothetical protein
MRKETVCTNALTTINVSMGSLLSNYKRWSNSRKDVVQFVVFTQNGLST